MKRMFFYYLCIVATTIVAGCSKDDSDSRNETFNYPLADLYGTWNGTHIQTSSGWIDITSSYYSDFQFSITFFEDGSYRGSGYFGNGTGTYRATGNTIITYVNGQEYYRYDVLSFQNGTAELRMYRQGETMAQTSEINIRVKKNNKEVSLP